MNEDAPRKAPPLRVLQSFAGLGRGGAEQLAMNWYRSIDRSRVQFDFVAEEREHPYEHEEEIARLGGRVFFVPRYRLGNLVHYADRWRRLLADHPEWRIVHAHHTTPAPIYLSVARAMHRIGVAHSHNTDQQRSIKALSRRMLGRPLNLIAHRRLACGMAAGHAMFGTGTFEVVPNCIDVDAFTFDAQIRAEVRTHLSCDSGLVVGHVGRFVEAKNHQLVIRIFRSLRRRDPSAKLLLVGDGPLRGTMEREVADLGISDEVQFLGLRDDVDRLMNAMDVFLLPSLYEGLPVTLVEAQANGLPSVISETITDEVRLTSIVRSVALSKKVEEWAEIVLQSPLTPAARREYATAVRGSGFDASSGAAGITTFYEALAATGR